MKKRDYTPVHWDVYFQKMHDVIVKENVSFFHSLMIKWNEFIYSDNTCTLTCFHFISIPPGADLNRKNLIVKERVLLSSRVAPTLI